MNKKLLLLSGPSCVGKTPMLKTVKKLHPEIRFAMPILYSSRKPRPVETEGVDFYFRSEEMIRSFSSEQYVVGKARTVWQALDLQELQALFTQYDRLVLEIYPTLGKLFLEHPRIRKMRKQFTLHTVFISPLHEDEISSLQHTMGFPSPDDAVAAVMLPKLVVRSQQQGKLITLQEMEDLRFRASRAFAEIEMGKTYHTILINHDGEDSYHWRYTPPIGDAGKTLKAFVKILSK
ncbi:hypothetical protein JXO59_06480 [candidate division KSB1 bacterium]|nr:hypothetical protein [candidate division KSB1 bacterium]